jgi:para-nitrobenzyl esterase
MKIMKACLSLLVVLLTLQTTAQENQIQESAIQISTPVGIVEGIAENKNVIAFKGIPFAKPPIGELRWKAPVPIEKWNGIRSAKQFGPKAMQTNIFGDMVFRSNGTSEDCLYLNVWKPINTGKKPLPVLVYYYGGGFVAGDGSEPRYDGASMAEQGIVAVTVNYRLGVFGLLAHTELSKESGKGSSGNYGLMDQALALQWVYDNIASFGGDPKKITIAGESAGSISVSALMASPLSKNLIAGAIGESGSILGALSALPLTDVEKSGDQFMKMVKANSIAELRNIPADSILTYASKFGLFNFKMSIDGLFFPKDPEIIFSMGEQANVPLLAGWNSEESNYRSIMGNDKLTVENFNKNVTRRFAKQAEALLKVYKPTNEAEVKEAARDLAGDMFISYSTWKWLERQKKTGQPAYRYYYEQPRPGDEGASHSAEIEYAMGNLDGNKVFQWTAEDRKVSSTMQSYFANFIKTGNPNGKGLPKWGKLHKEKTAVVMHIGSNTRQETSKHEDRYQTMNSFSSNNQ